MKPRKRQPSVCTSRSRVTASVVWAVIAAAATLTPSCALSTSPALATTDIDINTPPDWAPAPMAIAPDANVHNFQLRHIFHHGTYRDPQLHLRYDVDNNNVKQKTNSKSKDKSKDKSQDKSKSSSNSNSNNIVIPIRSSVAAIERLADRSPAAVEGHLAIARLTGQPAVLAADDWTLDAVAAPDVSDRDTVINMAIIASNAYAVNPDEGDWWEVGQGFNHSRSFGWDGDGLRGHVLADETNSTIVVSLKGTSPAVFDGEGTTTRDKINDNLFFSCCCAQGGQYFWRQVCECAAEGTYTCDERCVEQALRAENRYYRASIDLYTNITELYPDANVWVVGHSLGGSVSSLLGMTFGLPVVAFEAPGDDLAARRLGLPRPPTDDISRVYRGHYTGSVHIGHTADPVFMGTCNGATATCTLGGYAMESQCHAGLQCVYDTVGDWGWRVGIGYHKIHNVIDSVLRRYPTVPKCVPDDECVDCFNWKFFRGNRSSTTTSSSTTATSPATSSFTHTRTSTCETPGWFGCLDESTTTTVSATTTAPVVTTTYTTTTCLTPGWFGCKEEKNITITTTTLPPATTPATTTIDTTTAPAVTTTYTTTTCLTTGWFGCNEESFITITTTTLPLATVTATATATATPSESSVQATAPATSSGCKTAGWFGCKDTEPSSTTASPTSTCLRSGWLGCKEWATSTLTTTPLPTSAPPPLSTSTSPTPRRCKRPLFFGLFCLDRSWEENEL